LNPQQENYLKNLTDEQLIQLVQQDPKLKEVYEKLVKEQAGKLNTGKPMTSEEYLKIKNMEPHLDKEGGLTIEPATNFVFKTFEEGSNEKFFINLVTHPVIDEPEEKYLVDYENQPGIRIPMSLGKVKEDNDKKGQICKVVDAVMNPNTIDAVHKDPGLKSFMMEILATYIAEKYKIKLKPNFTVPKLKYKGKSIEFQRVKGKKAPKIQQLSKEEARAEEQFQRTGKRLIEDITGQNDKRNFVDELYIPRPEWSLYVAYEDAEEGCLREELYDGNFDIQRVRRCRYEVKLPLLATGTRIALTAKSGEFSMQAGKFYELLLKFPFKVDPLSVRSHFNTQTRILHLKAKVRILPKNVIDKAQATAGDAGNGENDDASRNRAHL
jgi:hypothetical protein